MPLEKAKLTEIEDLDGGSTRVSGPEIAVQFNPASLKLSFTNKIETQETKGQQTRQFIGMSSTSLSFDLEFDTSDEGDTDAPISVRTRTAAVERFLMPKGDGKEKQKPPKARFSWNETVVDGIIESLAIDLTHFASDGTPLRAKMSVSMQEQNAKYQSGKTGPGANSGNGGASAGWKRRGTWKFWCWNRRECKHRPECWCEYKCWSEWWIQCRRECYRQHTYGSLGRISGGVCNT